ncbi:MAG: hypothetical protein ACREVX_06790 [Clostridium sp.]
MKNKNVNVNDKQDESIKNKKSKESNPVIMNGDSNMRKPVRGLK